ncbi:MAG TPA: diacylglycerol kinase family protein [Verrucomicrobiae bacterium]|nr:diacylglycerol kinase family protein [Verrucomicrobiae bacterium]
MKKVILIYNPASGQRRERRERQMARIVELYRASGLEVEASATTHAGSAIEQTQAAVAAGFDTVIACGGDGTLNEALNGLVLSSSNAALGVVPLGSGNLLATDLRLPSDPFAAAQKLLRYKPRQIHPGVITSHDGTGPRQRYFVVAAGVGSDAELMYRTAVQAKERYGRNAYFLEMIRMALRGRYPMFQVEWEDGSGGRHNAQVALVMAIRARKFPGLLRFVNLDSALTRNDYRLVLFRTNKVRHFLNYFGSVASGLNWRVRQIELVHSQWFRCSALSHDVRIRTQADGELLGMLPVEANIAPQTVTLLMPE